MVNRCIGIDIGSSYLCAVQVLRTDEEFCIEKVFCAQIRRSTDSPQEMLRPLFSRHGFDKRADVAVSMPHDVVFFRNMETDSAGLEQVRKQNWSALEHNFPITAEEIIAQTYSYHPLNNEKYSVLTAASTRASLHERLNIFDGAKIHPSVVDVAIFAVHSTVAVNYPEIENGRAVIVYIDDCYLTLAITRDSDVVAVRSIPVINNSEDDIKPVQVQIAEVISKETRLTWRKVFGADMDRDTKIYLVTNAPSYDYIVGLIKEKLHSQTIIVDCCATIENLSDSRSDVPICVAEGLALRVLATEKTKGINFLQADESESGPAVNLKKEFVLCSVLICAIAVFLMIGLFMRLSRLESTYAHIKNETSEIFKAIMPDEKNVNPLVQLRQKVESLHRDSRLFTSLSESDLSPLDIFYKISARSVLKENIKVNDILIAANTVRINGTCDSFEPIYEWQRSLQQVPYFTNIDVKDIARESDSGLVEFTMLLSLSAREPK